MFRKVEEWTPSWQTVSTITDNLQMIAEIFAGTNRRFTITEREVLPGIELTTYKVQNAFVYRFASETFQVYC